MTEIDYRAPGRPDELAANVGIFLTAERGSTSDCWVGKMPAREQRRILGFSLGRGDLRLDGEELEVVASVSAAFGQDYIDVARVDLANRVAHVEAGTTARAEAARKLSAMGYEVRTW